jgi:hypothetical protein
MNVVVRLLRGKLLAMVGAVTMGCGSGSDSEQVPTAVATATPSSVKPLAVRLPDHSALFDWAEFTFPNFFPSHRINAESPPYVYRYYPETGNYVGLDGDKVVVLGPVSGGSILIVGSLADFACKVYPSDCWAPTIAVAPSSSVVTLHTSAGFAVRASASPDPGYQWQLSTDGGQVFSDILGATSSAYTTPATELGHDGHLYRVVISNSIGSVTSNAARLTVSPMPVSATTRASEGVIFTPDRQDIAPGGTADFQVRLLPGYTNLQVAGCGVILNDWAVPYEHKLLTPPLASNCVMTGSATKVSLTEGPYVLYGIGQSAAATFAGATDSIVVEARASGSFNRLLAEIADGRLDGVSSVVKSRSVQLLDDGISPDRMAGDGLWTGRISIPLVAALPEYGGREGRLPIFVRAYDRLGIEIVSSAGFGGRTENPVISHVVVDMSVPSPTLTQCAANAWRGDGFVNVVASRYSINAMRDALRSCVDTSQVDFIMRFPIGDADQWDWAYANPIRNDVLVQCAALFCTYSAVAARLALARVTLAKMSLALAVQMNGLGSML